MRAAERALEAAKKKRDEANSSFKRLDAAYSAQRDRRDRAHNHWNGYLASARDWTDSLTQDGARATKATERIEVEVNEKESAERRVPTPWVEEEEEEDLFGDNDTDTDTDNEGGWGGWGPPLPLPPPPPAKRSKRLVPEDDDGSSDDNDDVVMVGERSWKQRDDEARRKAVDLTSPRATSSCVDAAFRKIGL